MQRLRQSRAMQTAVEEIAAKFGLDLSEPGQCVRLELPALKPLVIGSLTPGLVGVSHYYELNGGECPDPGVVFDTREGWKPISYEVVGWSKQYVERGNEGALPEIVWLEGRWNLAAYCDRWARTLRDQGWLERGRAVSLNLQGGADAAQVDVISCNTNY